MNRHTAVIFDLDGTVCNVEHRRHNVTGEKKDWKGFFMAMADDKPNVFVVAWAELLARMGHKIFWVTGRAEEYRSITSDWLSAHVTGPAMYRSELLMRADGDYRADDIVKAEIYCKHIAPLYDVKLVVDDRSSVVQMWRAFGLECWQVAEGNF